MLTLRMPSGTPNFQRACRRGGACPPAGGLCGDGGVASTMFPRPPISQTQFRCHGREAHGFVRLRSQVMWRSVRDFLRTRRDYILWLSYLH